MSCIEAFADLAGISSLPSPPLNDSERTYLAGFLSGLQSTAGRQAGGVPSAAAERAAGRRHPAVAGRRCWAGCSAESNRECTPEQQPESRPPRRQTANRQ